MSIFPMGKLLTDSQIKQYHLDGFVAPIDLMPETEASEIAGLLEQAENKYPEHLNAENRNNAHLAFSFLDQLTHHPKLLDAVEDLIGHHYSLWGSVLFIKEPSTSHYVSWHQDATYMGIQPHDFVTPWIALTPSNTDTGCMTMIAGSHKDGIRNHEDTFADDNILTRGQQIKDFDASQAVDLILKPGQMSLHHCRTIHGSQPNRSSQRRVGFAIQGYMPTGATQTIGENYWLPIRGQCEHGDAIELQRPEFDLEPAAVARRTLVNDNWGKILYAGAQQKRAY